MTRAQRRLPIRKRFPGKYAARLIVATPDGCEIEFEVAMPPEYARQLQSDFVHLLEGKDPRGEKNLFEKPETKT